jgi:hypothetical protein
MVLLNVPNSEQRYYSNISMNLRSYLFFDRYGIKSATPFGACAERIRRRRFSIRLVQGTPMEKWLLGVLFGISLHHNFTAFIAKKPNLLK